MARNRAPTDFRVTVDSVGDFVFGKRTMRDEISIQVEFARMVNGVEPTAWLSAVCGWLAALKVLTVSAPDGWSLDDMDPLEDETYAKLAKVFDALSEQERSFRLKRKSDSQATGA